MNKGGIPLGAAIPSSQHPLEFVEPSEQTLNLPSPLVAPQYAPVLCRRPLAVALMRRNHLDALHGKRLIERIAVIGKIPDKSFGSSHGDSCIDGSLDKGDFMRASRIRVHGEWKTRSVCNDHELRALAPLGLSHFGSPFFATTKVPSIKHSDKSMCPTSSKWRASVSRICRITPALTQRLKRRKQVEPEGKRSGKSAQAAPVRSTHKIPFSTARSSCSSGLPRPSARRAIAGISGARIVHWALVSSSLRAMMKYHQLRKEALTSYL